jgi:hypothetical protein
MRLTAVSASTIDVQAGHPSILEGTDGARDVHHLAEAGVGVDEGG